MISAPKSNQAVIPIRVVGGSVNVFENSEQLELYFIIYVNRRFVENRR